jgi:hypothetical protein
VQAFASLDGGVFAPFSFSQSRFAQRALSYGLNITYARAMAIAETGRQLGEQLKPTLLVCLTSMAETCLLGTMKPRKPENP